MLSTCGEVHLQRCVRDLQETFAKVEVTTSEPLVAFRETVDYDELVETKKTEEKKSWTKSAIEKAERREKKERKKRNIDYGDVELDEDEMVTNTGDVDLTKEIEGYRKRLQQKEWTAKTSGLRNKAKLLRTSQLNTIEIKNKNPVTEIFTPNQRFIVRMRAVSLAFEVAEWLEKQSQTMERLFNTESPVTDPLKVAKISITLGHRLTLWRI